MIPPFVYRPIHPILHRTCLLASAAFLLKIMTDDTQNTRGLLEVFISEVLVRRTTLPLANDI